MESSDSGHEDINSFLGSFYLDPFTTILDENEFRVDLYELDNGYLIEAERIAIDTGDILIKIENDSCVIWQLKEANQKRRKIMFPFPLSNRSINVNITLATIEVYISKDYHAKHHGTYSCWLR